jgi:hypothetical protein
MHTPNQDRANQQHRQWENQEMLLENKNAVVYGGSGSVGGAGPLPRDTDQQPYACTSDTLEVSESTEAKKRKFPGASLFSASHDERSQPPLMLGVSDRVETGVK